MHKKSLLVLGAVALTAAASYGVFTMKNVYAETNTKYPPLVQKLIEHFNLSTSEVDKIMAQDQADREAKRAEMQAKRHQEIEDKLTQAVKDGKITEDQKTKILAKLDEIKPKNEDKPKREDLSKLTQAERKAKMEAFRKEREQIKADFEAWQKSLGVDLQEILGDIWPMGNHEGFGRPDGWAPETN